LRRILPYLAAVPLRKDRAAGARDEGHVAQRYAGGKRGFCRASSHKNCQYAYRIIERSLIDVASELLIMWPNVSLSGALSKTANANSARHLTRP
jgi:hypothetical protein